MRRPPLSLLLFTFAIFALPFYVFLQYSKCTAKDGTTLESPGLTTRSSHVFVVVVVVVVDIVVVVVVVVVVVAIAMY